MIRNKTNKENKMADENTNAHLENISNKKLTYQNVWKLSYFSCK